MKRALALSACVLVIAGCSSMPRPEALPSSYETGDASYYGSEFEGRKTASGERYDGDEMTAAHRTLPFGTRVRVVNLANDKSVEVRINDRGPHKKGRIVDVSRKAAKELGLIGPGVARVRLEVLAASKGDAR